MTEARAEAVEARTLGRYLRYLGCPDDRIDDLIQDARLAVIETDSAGTPVRRRLSFLRRCVRNRLIDEARADRPSPLLDEESILARDRRFDGLAGEDLGASFIADVRDCLGRLPERDRTLLRRRYWDREREAETARAFGISVSAVKKLVARARARMKTCLERKLR